MEFFLSLGCLTSTIYVTIGMLLKILMKSKDCKVIRRKMICFARKLTFGNMSNCEIRINCYCRYIIFLYNVDFFER